MVKSKPKESAGGEASSRKLDSTKQQSRKTGSAPSSGGFRRGGKSSTSRRGLSTQEGHGDYKTQSNAKKYEGLFQGVKRVASNDIDSVRPAQRRRIEEDGMTMTEAQIRSQYQIPTSQDYPTAPKTLFTAYIASAMHNFGSNILKLRMEYEVFDHSLLRCTVHCTRPNGEEESAVGDGSSKVIMNGSEFLLSHS